MDFRITGLSPEPFRPLFGLSDSELARRYVADVKPGFPDRVELRDAEPGETLILVNHTHQPADTPYRASHAIFVLEAAEIEPAIERLLGDPEVAYIQAHYATRGCYAARIERA